MTNLLDAEADRERSLDASRFEEIYFLAYCRFLWLDLKKTKATFSEKKTCNEIYSFFVGYKNQCLLNMMDFDWNWILYHDENTENERSRVIVGNWRWSKTRGYIWKISISWDWTSSWIITITWRTVYRVGLRLFIWLNLILVCSKVLIESFSLWFWSRISFPFSVFTFAFFAKRIWNEVIWLMTKNTVFP